MKKVFNNILLVLLAFLLLIGVTSCSSAVSEFDVSYNTLIVLYSDVGALYAEVANKIPPNRAAELTQIESRLVKAGDVLGINKSEVTINGIKESTDILKEVNTQLEAINREIS